jgi:threonine dehydrogenase-like Zn-dependent dehydrogenase
MSPCRRTGAFCRLPLEADLVTECTGVGQVVINATHLAALGAVVALTGISSRRSPRRGWTR